MTVYELFFRLFLAADIAWGVLVALYLFIALPISYLIVRKRDHNGRR